MEPAGPRAGRFASGLPFGRMSVSTRYETVVTPDGASFDAFCAVPAGGSGPGILLFQEIFGINDNMRGLAEKLARQGYVVLVPGHVLARRAPVRAEGRVGPGRRLRHGPAVRLRGRRRRHPVHPRPPPVDGGVLRQGRRRRVLPRWRTGLRRGNAEPGRRPRTRRRRLLLRLGVNDLLGHVDALECPCMFHYGSNDAYIPTEKIEEVEQAVAGRPGVDSTATTQATPSAIGMRRPCTTRPRPTRPGPGPSPSSTPIST